MPKTFPKSSKNDDLAECRPQVGERSKVKRRHSELEPNSAGEDGSSRATKRPNRTELTNQRVYQRSAVDAGEATPSPPPASPPRADFLLQALQRIQELQDEIDFLENDPYAEDADSSENDEEYLDPQVAAEAIVVGHQAEALGFAVCVRETMAFLEREGVPADSPMMVNLRSRLVGRCEQNLSC
ncbi:uncharacterized protein LOC134220190 [Armigeres subalbatus]|uniref:uncharacterized protein LOC134220190 n=1 Tax=Armigeres subalbatus TaxID=124917 RepID=UPI002ED38C38